MSHGRDNLRPHAEARLAMAYFGKEYAAQRGGCMDFWDGLAPYQQELITRILDEFLRAMKENGRATDWKGSQP